MTERPDLAALMGSRICHDLISPIGAIGNGVELLLMDGVTRSPEMALVLDSVTHANARIRFFRIAFGLPGNVDHLIAASEVTGVLEDVTRGGRLSIAWSVPNQISRREVKLALLIMMCVETALPHGGRISFERGDGRWTIRGSADHIVISQPLWDMLANPALHPEIGPAQVQFALLREELARQPRRVTVEIRDGEVKLTF